MGRSALTIPVAMAAVLVAFLSTHACSDDDGDLRERPDGGVPCNQGFANCPAGFVCANRYCVQSCSAAAPCPAGMYCGGDAPDDVCAPNEVTTCVTNNDCPLTQLCGQGLGLCVSYETKVDGGAIGCIPGADDQDQCGASAVCYPLAAANQCVGLPACSADGGCPPSFSGSVCNELPDGGRIFPSKRAVCLAFFCARDENCSSARKCGFFDTDNPGRGACTSGIRGDFCFTEGDCFGSTAAAPKCAGADGGLLDGGYPGRCN